MCCQFCHRVRVLWARLQGAERRGDFWILGDSAWLDPSKLL
jgi:hypothetical protein